MSAIFSECGIFRYRLDRDLGGNGPVVALLGVNPSTADAEKNDATIRKDIGFGQRLGWRRIIKGNKFAFCATDIKALRFAPDAVGPENNFYLEQIMREADIIIAAWGPLAKLPRHLQSRWSKVLDIGGKIGKPFMCFGRANDGQPLHTLMLPYSAELRPWHEFGNA